MTATPVEQPVPKNGYGRRVFLGSSALAGAVGGIGAMLGTAGPAAASPPNQLETEYIVLAADGTGDFGPQTAGTKTFGWQEAINQAVATRQNLYVKGGEAHVVYNISETIVVPPTQDWRILGNCYILNWVGAADDPTQDLIRFDSSMNCDFQLGILVYGGLGAALRVKPVNPVPVDHFVVTTETGLYAEGVVDPNPFSPGTTRIGDGIVFDASVGPILWNRLRFNAVANFATSVLTTGNFTNNNLDVLHLHSNRIASTLCDLAAGAASNTVALYSLGADQGATDVTALRVAGKRNGVTIKTRNADKPFGDGKVIVFADTASDNRVEYWPHADYDLDAQVTDAATTPTNRVQTPHAEAARPVTLTSGQAYVQRLQPAELSFDHQASVTITRGGVTVQRDSLSSVVLSAGDSVTLRNPQQAAALAIPVQMN